MVQQTIGSAQVFSTTYEEIWRLVDAVDPVRYGRTRNFKDGAVTRLSPYISRGVISTRQVAKHILSKGYKPEDIDSFLRELAWRDYFQQVWIAKGDEINKDVKQAQPDVRNHKLSASVLSCNTGIAAVDSALRELNETGYMHNHMRMYTASLCCNIAKSHWYVPAKWMYYHLLDADWASNALSWQWVAGSFSSKKYFANQENINKYFNTTQAGTFIDVPYEQIDNITIPSELSDLVDPILATQLPDKQPVRIDEQLPTCLYNFYNLDPMWMKDEVCNRVLLLEPSHFDRYPVCESTIAFVLALSKNIEGIQVYVGEYDELWPAISQNSIYYKEHPTNRHYKGEEHSRDWMFEQVTGYYPSFFSFWKRAEKFIGSLQQGRLEL